MRPSGRRRRSEAISDVQSTTHQTSSRGSEASASRPAIRPESPMSFAFITDIAMRIIDSLLLRYEYATADDFGFLAVAVIMVCWFVSKYYAD